MADNKFPNCTQEVCSQHQNQINQICSDPSFPPGTPIVVYNATSGGYCYCYCGGQPEILSPLEADAAEAGPSIEPCGIAICNYDPKILKACAPGFAGNAGAAHRPGSPAVQVLLLGRCARALPGARRRRPVCRS